ncbi:unnamed protein product [Rotaria sp. Silwood1]|nr:unnamed protein product [Rotaria sp. Silwood1]
MFIYTPYYCFISVPLRASFTDIQPNAKWAEYGTTVAGGYWSSSETDQLSYPWGLYVDDDQTVYVADGCNWRIVEWKSGAKRGQVVAGGKGDGHGTHQLSCPKDVIVDRERDSLIICDRQNEIVVQWPRRNGTSGEAIISDIACVGLTMDENGSLYVVDNEKHEVRRYKSDDTKGTLVAGGNGKGNGLDQLSDPQYVFVDRDHSVYVSDSENHRVMKWEEGATQGIVVAGGHGEGNSLTQLNKPEGVVVDQLGTVYVADSENHRIIRWPKGATQGDVIVGGKDKGAWSDQLSRPVDFPKLLNDLYTSSFSSGAVHGGFRRAGIWPWDGDAMKDKVVRRASSSNILNTNDSSASSILSSLVDEIRTSNVDTNNSNNSSSAIQMDIDLPSSSSRRQISFDDDSSKESDSDMNMDIDPSTKQKPTYNNIFHDDEHLDASSNQNNGDLTSTASSTSI